MGRLLIMLLALAALAAPAASPPQADTSGYVWDRACKDCHSDIYDAWERTKHARALSRLGGADRERECVQCHITGSARPVLEDMRIVNANVQCESCHGPGRAHVEAAKAGTSSKGSIVRKPPAAECERCHNARSPNFKGFFYEAMLGFSHRVRG